VGSSKPPTSPLVWIAGGCSVLVVLYLLISCVLPAIMFGAMGLTGLGSTPSVTPVASSGVPYDLGPPSTGGPMLPPDPSELAAPDAGTDAGSATTLVPAPSNLLLGS
jgi:hypothetical protein